MSEIQKTVKLRCISNLSFNPGDNYISSIIKGNYSEAMELHKSLECAEGDLNTK